MNPRIETHFWGQEGAAREYNTSIWALPNWPVEAFQDRIPKDLRDSYIGAALSGTQWRIDTAESQIALTHFKTIQIPGGTGFLAATQVFPRGFEPGNNVPGQLKAQLDLAVNILTATKVFVRPTNIPASGDFNKIYAMPAEANSTPDTWVVSQVDNPEKVLFALQRLANLRNSQLTVFLSPKPQGDASNQEFKATQDITFDEFLNLVEKDKHAYDQEEQKRQQREQDEKAKRQVEEMQREFQMQYNSPGPSKNKTWLWIGLSVLGMVLASGATWYFLRGDNITNGHDKDGDHSETFISEEKIITGCTDPKALNFDPKATQGKNCQFKEKVSRIDANAGSLFQDTICWREHQFDGQEKRYRCVVKDTLNKSDIDKLKTDVNEQLKKEQWGDYVSAKVEATNSDLDITLLFSEVNDGKDRITIRFDEKFGMPVEEIRISINHLDRDADDDGFLASKDKFPFEGGRCDGNDYDRDGIDDLIDLDDDNDKVLDAIDEEPNSSLGEEVNDEGINKKKLKAKAERIRLEKEAKKKEEEAAEAKKKEEEAAEAKKKEEEAAKAKKKEEEDAKKKEEDK